MLNPILQMLQPRQSNNINQLINMIKTGNPNDMFNQMMQTNPQFAQFVRANQGKSPEQIAQENGINLNMLKSMIK